MATPAERRALYYSEDPDHDPFIGVDVNEYLIDEWPQLTLKQRRAVWSSCQRDEDFDFEALYEQIDDAVFLLAESDPSIDLPDDSDSPDDDGGSTETLPRSSDQTKSGS